MKRYIYSFVLVSLIVILSLLYYLEGIQPPKKSIILISLFVVAFCLFIIARFQQSSQLKGQWAKPSNVFLLAFIIIYYQYPVDYLIGYKKAYEFYSSLAINSCVLISDVGLLSLTLGLINSKYNLKTFYKRTPVYRYPLPLVVIQILVFVLYIKETGLSNILNGSTFESGYVREQGISDYFEYVLQMVNVAIVVYCLSYHNSTTSFKDFLKTIPITSLCVIILYIILKIPSGDRGPFIITAFLLFYAFLYSCRKQIRVFLLLLVVLAGGYALSVIGIARNYDLSSSFSERLREASISYKESGRFEDSMSILNPTQELAFSFVSYQCMVSGIEIKGDNHTYGRYQAIELINAIPLGPRFVRNQLHLSGAEAASSSYATYEFFGHFPSFGLGSNIVGDFFMDFGILGVLVALFLVGLFYGKVDNELLLSSSSNVYVLAFAFVYATRAIIIPRATFLGELRGVVLVVIMLYINQIYTQLRHS